MKHWILESHTESHGEFFLIGDNLSLSRDDFITKSLSAAKYLSSRNIREGDHVAIYCDNKWEYLSIVQALWFIGAVPILFHTRVVSSDLEKMINTSNSKFIITDKIDIDSFAENKIDKIFVNQIFEFTQSFELSSSCGFNVNKKAVCLFTSGSTGKSKLVVHTFNSLKENFLQSKLLFNFTEIDIWLLSLPLYHIGGFMIFVRALLSNAQLFFPKNSSQSEILSVLKSKPITHCSIVPTTLQRMTEENFRPNKSVRNIFVGGGPGDTNVLVLAVQAGYPISKVYGSTETSSMICALSGDFPIDKIESVGKPIGNTKLLIDTSNSQKLLSAGEILIKTNSIFTEYYNDEQATQDAFKDGYYESGDAGYFDDEGFLYITGRIDNIIVSGGENISSLEVEESIKSIAEVKEAVVVGIDDLIWGKAVAAAIVLKESCESDEVNIRNDLKKQIAPHKIPKKIIFVKSIPQNEMGKTNYSELEKLFKD
jgi:O-succinylbenzoic acid--CoA ligase